MTSHGLPAPPQAAPIIRRSIGEWPAAAALRRVPFIARVLCLSLAVALFCLRYPLATASGLRPPLIVLVAVVLVVPACWRRGGMTAWIAFMVGIAGFEALRAVADDLGFPAHAGDLRQLEQSICFGIVPSYALQHLLFTPASPGIVDYASVAIHGSFFVAPYVVLGAIWTVRPGATGRLAYPLLATFGVGLVVNALLPGVPPWLASSQPGSPEVHRVLYVVTSSVAGAYEQVGEGLGDPNPIACLPSLHFAVTFLLFLYARSRSRLWGLVGVVYCLAMAFALVYLGEHYVVDCILGTLLALAVWHAGKRLRRDPLELASWRVPWLDGGD